MMALQMFPVLSVRNVGSHRDVGKSKDFLLLSADSASESAAVSTHLFLACPSLVCSQKQLGMVSSIALDISRASSQVAVFICLTVVWTWASTGHC